MSPGRRVFFLSICALGLLWCAAVLVVSDTRFDYRNLIETIRAGTDAPGAEAVDSAIAAYRSSLRIAPCSAALHQDLALLLGQHADAAQAMDEDAPLAAMQDELTAHLSCSPTDGKAWLDFATIDIYREGFTPKAAAAYRLSQRVAPGESWLAQKRLLFALQFHDLLTPADMRVARQDILVLKRAHPNRMKAVLASAGIADEAALSTLFADDGRGG